MPVDSVHPFYEKHKDDWKIQRDCEAGELVIKNEGEVYLPKPQGFTAQPDDGVGFYNSYRMRAQFPDIIKPTLAGMVGVIHRVEAKIEGLDEGKPLEFLWEKATKDGLTLEAFHRRITSELLLMGRYVVLTDLPKDTTPSGSEQPFLVGYTTEMLINWSDPDRNLFVLDETANVQGTADDNENGDEFAWDEERRFRVLRLTDGVYTQQVYDKSLQGGEIIEPQLRGGKRLQEIPLVAVNPNELSLDMDAPPLIGVSRASLAIYRLDADYRHQLFHSGQETLFCIGETENLPKYVGSGVVIGLPLGADAKMVGPSGQGIAAHRVAIMDERQSAVAAGVKLFDTQAKAESGEALRLRAAAQTATLTTVAQASAAALEKALRYAAMFVGQDPNEIVVKPNLKFVDTAMTPQEAEALVKVWQSGAIAYETLYENLQRGEVASAERTAEEEQDMINEETIDQPMMQGNDNEVPEPEEEFGRFVETGKGLRIK